MSSSWAPAGARSGQLGGGGADDESNARTESYERSTRRWLARLCEERRGRVGLNTVSEAAALSSLPDQPAVARTMRAAVCRCAELQQAACAFAPEH